jgi:nucleoside-diphosphate-sugar epimerase
MSRIAIVGAAGFVGMRLAEMAWLGGEFDFVPVIRNFKSFARLSKYGRACQYADAGDASALQRVLVGCDTVVNLTMGDDARTLSDTQTLLAACEAARARVLVHLSTAEVFGRVVSPTVADDSPPVTDHWMAYARAKIATETWLRPRMAASSVRVVALRPGLIWGPRSPWVVGPATALLEGTACLFGGGQGICNLVHVDTLARDILAVARHPDPRPGFYNVGDPETVTWRQYFEELAAQMRLVNPRLHELPIDSYHESILRRFITLKDIAPARAIKRRLRNQT